MREHDEAPLRYHTKTKEVTIMLKRVITVLCLICLVAVLLCGCTNNKATNSATETTADTQAQTFPSPKDSYTLEEITNAFRYGSEQPQDMSTMLMRDMNEIKRRLGDKEPVYVSDEYALCEYKCVNGGSLYVAFWNEPEEYNYYPIEFVAFTMKELCFDDFDIVQLHSSTLQDVEAVDPATSVTYIDYGEEKYTTHLTKDGIIKINYVETEGETVADSIEILHQNPVKCFYN